MKVLNPTNLNDYVVTACALAELSYIDESTAVIGADISSAVVASNTTTYDPSQYDPNATTPLVPSSPIPTNVVWGPAYVSPTSDPAGTQTYSLMYITQVEGSSEYFVVIRGTNFGSIVSWYSEDLAIYSVMQLNSLPNLNTFNISDDVTISQATYTAALDLLNLQDPTTSKSALAFLQGKIAAVPAGSTLPYVYITGHSLGGTICPVMYAYLANLLVAGSAYENMAMFTFAGLTAGGDAFNEYIATFNSGIVPFQWRIQNSLDIAPFLFQGPIHDGIPSTIYGIYPIPINPDFLPSYIHDYLSDLFTWSIQTNTNTPDTPRHWPKAPVAALPNSTAPGNNFYEQPAETAGNLLAGTFETNLTPILIKGKPLEVWAVQALYQHHSNTYYNMVAVNYHS